MGKAYGESLLPGFTRVVVGLGRGG